MKNSRFVYSLSFIAIMFCSVLSFVPANENPTARNVVKKANDTTLDVDLSKTYAQIGSHEGVDKLRFVTAIDMSNENVEKVNYTRIADFATTTTVEKEVTSLYKSVAGSEDTVYYYDGTELVNNNPENGYYFASYVVAYKSSTNKAKMFTVAMDVNDDAAKAPFLTTSYNAIAAGKEANATASFVVDGELVGRCIVEQGNAPVYYLGTEEGQYWSDSVNYFEELPTITTDTVFTLVSFADVQASAKSTIAGYQLVAGEYTEANLAEYNSVISKAQASVDAATTLDDVNYIVKNAKYDVERLPELFSYTPISTVEEWQTLITENPAGKFKLMNDIDLEGGWLAGSNKRICNGFSGILDGQGYAIKNAKHEGANAAPTIFGDNSGIIKNIAFTNFRGMWTFSTRTGLVSSNLGSMENIYVDWMFSKADNVTQESYNSVENGIFAVYSSTGTMRNCIANLRLKDYYAQDGFKTTTGMGSLVGKANNYNGHLYNCHAIINSTGIKDISATDGASGKVTAQFKNEGSAQHQSYYHMYKDAQDSLATFDSSMWNFTENGIQFGKTTNYVDEYTYITNADEFKTVFYNNPSGKFRLANDIDLMGGYTTDESYNYLATTFSGVFDGMGYKIYNGWMRGGWNSNSLFSVNDGLIMNIAFEKIYGNAVQTNTALIGANHGTMKNLYVDWYIKSDGRQYGEAEADKSTGGVLANFSSTGTIRNCIVNLGLHELDVAPDWQGSLIGKADNYNGTLANCHSIVNGTGVNDLSAPYGSNHAGVLQQFKDQGSAQHETYGDLYANATTSLATFYGNIWTFTETGISFFGREVLTYTAPEVTA